MVYYLLVCRSLTYAQRSRQVLERAGITAHILRTPRSIAGEGCSHAVRVGAQNGERAVGLLREVGLSPRQVFSVSPDGRMQAAHLGQL